MDADGSTFPLHTPCAAHEWQFDRHINRHSRGERSAIANGSVLFMPRGDVQVDTSRDEQPSLSRMPVKNANLRSRFRRERRLRRNDAARLVRVVRSHR